MSKLFDTYMMPNQGAAANCPPALPATAGSDSIAPFALCDRPRWAVAELER